MAPKRPAESYTGTGSTPSASSSSSAAASAAAATAGGKRVKFAPGDSTATGAGDDLDAEDLEAGAGGAGSKKDKVVTDGYDSDSSAGSDGGFGVGGGRKGRKDGGAAGGGEDDEEDDMFGDGDGVGENEKAEKKGKGKEFLEMGDIEGQEFGRGEDGAEEQGDEEEEDYVPEDDLANADDAPRGKRSKEGMGYQLSSFNMQDELAEGRFSADGSYVQNAVDPLATHDTWLDGVSKKSIKAARESKLRMEEDARRREEQEAKGDGALAQERDDCMIGLLGLIREGETVTKALSRLGATRKKVVRRKVKAKSSDEGDEMEVDGDDTAMASVEEPAAAAVEEDPAVKKINRITHLASTLLAQGELEIYDTSYEDMIKTLKEEGAVRRDWIPPRDPDIEREVVAAASAARDAAATSGRRVLIARPGASGGPPPSSRYLYRWVVPQEGQPEGQEYGPFPRSELEGWIAQGYFGGARAEKIVVKPEGKEAWVSWQEAIA